MLSESLAQAILATKITGPQLDAYLNTSQGLKAWRVLLNSRSLSLIFNKPSALVLLFESGVAIGDLLSINGAALAASDSATEAICKSGSALLTIVSDDSLLNLWNDVPSNKTRMNNQINAPGSKIVRAEQTSTGEFVIPAGAIAFSYFAVGSGGNGHQGTRVEYGGGKGGSGAESKWGFITSSIPSSIQITFNTPGSGFTQSVFGSLFTLENGVNGGAWRNSDPVSGRGTNSGVATYDTDFRNSLFQPYNGSKKGGDGAGVGGGNRAGWNGSVGAFGAGGLGGQSDSPYTRGGEAGSGCGSGGGSGAYVSSGTISTGGESAGASDYGCGGGGGGANGTNYGLGGSGKNGIFVGTTIIGD